MFIVKTSFDEDTKIFDNYDDAAEYCTALAYDQRIISEKPHQHIGGACVYVYDPNDVNSFWYPDEMVAHTVSFYGKSAHDDDFVSPLKVVLKSGAFSIDL